MTLSPWLQAAAVRRAGVAAYGPHDRQQLEIYRPRGETVPLPVVIFFYGGRWRSGSRRQYRLLARVLAAPGRVVVLPDYRLYPEVRFPTFVQDAQAALAWAGAHASEYGGDPRRVFLIGHSAGAHLASLAALGGVTASEPANGERHQVAVAGVVGLAGPYDLLPIRDPVLQDIFGEAGSQPDAQPLGRVHPQAPPFLLLHGGRDRVVGPGQSKRMWRRLNDMKASGARLVYMQRLGHFRILTALLGLSPQARVVQEEVARFIASPVAAVGRSGPDSHD